MGCKLLEGAPERPAIGLAADVLDVGEFGVTQDSTNRIVFRHCDGFVGLTPAGRRWNGYVPPKVRRLKPGELIGVTT